MATNQEIADFYAANKDNPAAIQAAMQQYGVSADQAAQATGQGSGNFQFASTPAAPQAITQQQIQEAWNANKNDPQKVYELMMKHGASYRDVAQAAGMSTEKLNQYLAMPIFQDASHPYLLNYRGVPVNSQGMEMDVSNDPNWRDKIDMRQADPHFGYTSPKYGRADDPYAMDAYSSFYDGMGGPGPRPGSANIGGRPQQFVGETNRPGHYVAPATGFSQQQNGQPSANQPRASSAQPAAATQPAASTASADYRGGALSQYAAAPPSPPAVVADGGQYLADGTWSDVVNGQRTGTTGPRQYAGGANSNLTRR